MEWKFTLKDIEIEEPIGFAELELSLLRDDKLHGIGFEASTSSLRFHGNALAILREEKEMNGVTANVPFTAFNRCDSSQEFEPVISGRLNFGKYKETCGSSCFISIPWEADSCALVMKSRYDQKVDINKATAFDNMTPLIAYPALGVNLSLPPKDILAAIDGSVAVEPEPITFSGLAIGFVKGGQAYVRPTYGIERYNNIQTGNLQPVSSFETAPFNGFNLPISPQFLYEDIVSCFTGSFDYAIRFKGSYTLDNNVGQLVELKIRLLSWDANGDIFTNGVIIEEKIVFVPSPSLPYSGTFDETLTGTLTLAEGFGLYALVYFRAITGFSDVDYTVTFDPETYFTLTANRSCPATDAQVYLIHETLSRVTEAITEGCMRVKSDYYGRVDSLPFASAQDGCGGLRALTSGLYVRRAPEPTYFTSLQELIEGLYGIDNIGIGVEDDLDREGAYLLRVEDVDFFYQNIEILTLNAIPEANTETEEAKHYSKILVGYKQWEANAVNGLGEIQSTREYRTGIKTTSSTLDLTSNLVTGSYLIETTRQQSFADSGGADTGMDDETFLISLERGIYGLQVEQGNAINTENIYSPETLYNYRLSPLRNLFRWYKSILPALPNFTNIAELLFNAGTGNITAKGEMESTFCKQEKGPIRENQDVYITQYNDAADYLPLWRNENITFEYPLSIGEYKRLKAAPYGYINFQCGNGDFQQGWIKEVKYKPVTGMATFVLRKKYG